ncbi:hypothetical protein B0H10DRAFT_2225654 [Mycena sp. CBHHK59/15]|nr:hypothetical protein B0H10DRAFT_2225654 [Mycena sp. CBHHK59/15]
MSSYTPTDSNSVTPGLSAAAPFADVLRARSEDAPLPPSTKALEAAGPPAPPPAYTQKGLGKTHGAGLRNVQDSLVANNGGISSSSHLLPPPPSHSDHSPTPPPRISTVTHFGMTEYTDAKAETALHMAKRAIQDLHILADALRVNETRVQRLEVDVTKVVIEHRLSHVFPSDDLRSTRPRSPSITQNRSRSPTRGRSRSTTPSHSHSPQPRNRSRSPARSYHDPIDELIAALEANSSDEGPSAISVKELTLQAGRLQTINGELRSENKALRKDLDAVQKDLTALQAQLTQLELNTPAPLRSSSHSKAPDPHFVHPRHSLPALRSRSPTLDLPSKRRKFHESGGFLTVGLSPRRSCL